MTAKFVWLAVFLACSAILFAQTSDPKKPKKSAQETTQKYYKQWLEEYVAYIITPEERAVFRKLTADEEKEAFIEQFWRRRDPDPQSPINELKEEHYRRLAYANDHFKSGIDGWATDRGRIYIMFGPPSTIEDHAGGPYRRSPDEGGGTTSTYAFQEWFYNHIPGIGSGIRIEFVDASKTGEYRLALRPSEKDALWYAGAAPTIEEQMGLASRGGAMTADLAMRSMGFSDEPSYVRGFQAFDRVRQYFLLSKPPEIKFKDLTTIVDASVSYNSIPIEISSGSYRVGENAFLVPLTIRIPADQLAYKTFEQVTQRAVVNIYGKVQTPAGQVVYEFEDLLEANKAADKTSKTSTHLLYQKQLPLRPGRYKVTIIAKDQESKRIAIGTAGVNLAAPSFRSLATGSLILADWISSSSPDVRLTEPFISPSGLKVYPNVTQEFSTGSTVNFYTEVYEVALDPSTRHPFLDAKLTLLHEGRPVKTDEPHLMLLSDRVVLLQSIQLKGLTVGSYQLMLRLHDRISGQQLVKRVSLKILPT